MRLPNMARVGILALCVGIVVFGFVHYWVNTRTWMPRDIPVTLAPGPIQTGDFQLNVEAYFSVQITFPYNSGSGCGEVSALRTRRRTSIAGQLISAPDRGAATGGGITRGTYLGSFRGK